MTPGEQGRSPRPGEPDGGSARPAGASALPQLIVVVLGTVALALALFVFRWFRGGSGDDGFFGTISAGSKFTDLHAIFDRAGDALRTLQGPGSGPVDFGLPELYVDWLGYLLASATVLAAAVALTPSSMAGIAGPIAGVLGAGSAAVTIWSLDLLRSVGRTVVVDGPRLPSFGDYLTHSGPGAWLAVAGFLATGVGGLIGRPDPARNDRPVQLGSGSF